MGKNTKRNKKAKQQQQQSGATAPPSGSQKDPCALLTVLSPSQRQALNKLVGELIDLVKQQPANPNEEWRQYEALQRLLVEIMALEEPLSQALCPDGSDSPDDRSRLAKVEAFSLWANRGGVRSEGLEIATFAGYQLGLRATRPLEKDEPVITVPRDLILAEDVVEWHKSVNLPKLTYLYLAYDLLIEKIRGESSEWQPYLDVLPAKYNTVMYFSSQQMERLRGTAACSMALRQCLVIAKQYAKLYWGVHVLSDGIRKEGFAFAQRGLCYKLFRWAVSTVMTRQNLVPRTRHLSSQEQPTQVESAKPNTELISALIPYWDMANHRPGKITSFYDECRQQLECTAQEPCAAGEQFFIYYGDRSNADLLVHNGFVDVDNRKDYVNICVGLSRTDELAARRARILDKLGILHNAELRVLPAPEFVSRELLAFVRVFKMSAEQLDHWCSDLERAGDLLHIDCALETDHETRTWQFLEDRLKLLLAVLDKQSRDDEPLSPQEGQEIEFMLQQYRRLERSILSGALQYAREHRKV
ncbi:actin-histidine N-methyltransferase [Drosophila ficusphila]|uniref:actin-histidine N-methyltransferase n=1 Tax=Drosophila ficusphila TaxID=30025 RepID=UPI0007E64B53|nr:actin-histidine N-methyltransferase [Drosophila ficusphila]